MRIKLLNIISTVYLLLGVIWVLTIPTPNTISRELWAETESQQPSGKELPDLGAAQPAQGKDAKELVNEALKNLDSVKAMHITTITRVEPEKGDKWHIWDMMPEHKHTAKGIYKNNPEMGVAYGRVLNYGADDEEMDRFDYYEKVNGKFFVVRWGKDKKWQRELKRQFGMIEDELSLFRDRMKAPKVIGAETLDGLDCLIIESPLATHGFQNIFQKHVPEFLKFLEAKFVNPVWKVWLGKKDNYVHKSVFSAKFVFQVPDSIIEVIPPPPPVDGEKRAAYLGITGNDVGAGVEIIGITPDTAANKFGLKEGDIITEFDGRKVKTILHLQKMVKKHKPGDEVKIKILRGDEDKAKILSMKGAELEDLLKDMEEELMDLKGRDKGRRQQRNHCRIRGKESGTKDGDGEYRKGDSNVKGTCRAINE